MSVDDAPAVRLLTHLFVRRLLDNDVISPHADRHDSLGVLYAVIVSLALFVTFFVSTPYLAAYIQLPGQTALSALPDRFLFIAASLGISALAALLVWDALGLELRDAAILGPLPIAPWTITRAKLLAALVFGVVFSIAVNVVPSIVYPTFMTVNLRGVTGGGLVRLIAAQAISVIMAGLLGFFAVLAARGVLRLALGERGFGRVSSGVQSLFVVAAVTGLMLTPTIRGKTVTEWIAGSVVLPRYFALPVLWHVGVNETVAGDVVVDAPAVMPRRVTLPAWMRRDDEEHRSAYRALRANLATLARWAWLVVPAVVSLAVLTFVWNNRRLPEPAAARPAQSRTSAAVLAIALRLTRGDPEAQAGFFFTLHALMRSGPHRMIVAISVAAALTLPSVMLILGSAYGQEPISSFPLGLLGMQVTVLLVLIGGFRHAVMVPAELVANWSIRMAWRGDERGYLAGVKRAAFLSTVVVPSLVLLPLHVALFGAATALVHALFGCLFGVAALDGLFLGYRKVPFACAYLPLGDPKLLWSGGAATLLLVPYAFAYIERAALKSPAWTAGLAATLAGIVLTIKIIDLAQRRERQPLDFDERPAPPTQRLGVFDSMAIHD
jgi:hypothetical protein